nr:PREDICTED: mediator of RNA polymerase II transcription subunit 10 [Bos mutus]
MIVIIITITMTVIKATELQIFPSARTANGTQNLRGSRPYSCWFVTPQYWNFIVTGLQDIDKCRQQLHDITVPLEVFEYIDQGRNPQLYTKECLERALAKNEQVKGKIDTMKKFKSLLIQELSKVFPEDMAKYRSIRGEDHPPS